MIFCDIIGRSTVNKRKDGTYLKIHAVVQAPTLEKAESLFLKKHENYKIIYAKACDIGESILCERRIK